MEQKRRTNAFVGSPVERIEDLRLLKGRGQYVDDLTRPGLLHAAILRSSVAHGRIRAIDTAAARARPGVVAVITAADIGAAMPTIPLRQEPLPALRQYQQPVIAHRKVRYVGEPIAVVVAESAALAEDALEAILVDIEALPAVADRAAARSGDVLLFEESGTNVASTITAVRGDVDVAFRAAAYMRRERFKVQRHTAVPMEPRGLLAEWKDGRLTLSGAAKVPFPNRRMLARKLGVPEAVDPHGGKRRRRRLRGARRILSGRFPDTVRGAPHRTAGEMDRRPPRASPGHQPRPRRRLRAGDRLRPRRHHPGPARPRLGRSRRLSAHQSARPRRATPRR